MFIINLDTGYVNICLNIVEETKDYISILSLLMESLTSTGGQKFFCHYVWLFIQHILLKEADPNPIHV